METKQRRILLADDDEAVQEVVRRIAEKRGHEVLRVTAGTAILETAIRTQPDVIVLDMQFPDADGRDVLARLKSDPSTTRIPVIVWSGRVGHESDRRIALELGAEDYVEKNEAQLLLRKLDRVLLKGE